MTAVRRLAAGALALALLGLAPAALADPPSRLPTPLTDTAGALDAAGRAEVEQAQAELLAEESIQLWVAYVPTFDGLSGSQWAAETAELSGFGGNDMLFAVALEDRAYGYDVGPDVPVSDSELEEVLATEVEPELAAGDWAGAAVALADGIAQPSGGGTPVPLLVGGLVVVGVGVLLMVALVRRGQRRAAGSGAPATGAAGAPPEPVSIDQLRQQAAAALIEADDSIRTSEQELGFATAQFGDAAAAPFVAALAQSKQDLARAFHVQRRAQEAAGTPAEAGLLGEILDLSRAADARLDEQVEAFDALRDMERRIDSILPDLGGRVEQLQARLTTSQATTEALQGRWPPAALAPLTRNLDEAAQRITFAAQSVQAGTAMLAAERSGAVAHARAAEEAIGQATTLLDNVDRAPEILDLAQRAIAALVAESERDIAEAERLGLPPEVASTHTFAVETLRWARTAIDSGNYDPIATRRALEESDSALEKALVPLREATESRRRAEALLATTTDAARMSIQAADDFIATRRGAVGAEARTRLAQAQREYAEGQAATDPVEALRHMQAADHLSDQAHWLAQQDEAQYRNTQQMGGGGPGNLGSIILGGILIDAMTRGGRGGGMGLPGGGSRGPGSFGGGGTRGRRSGGGRF